MPSLSWPGHPREEVRFWRRELVGVHDDPASLPTVDSYQAARRHVVRARVALNELIELLLAVPEYSQNPTSAHAATDEAIVAWRARVETEEAKKLHRARASLCELMNAHLRTHHGVDQFPVRGLAKVTCVVLLGVITSNLLQHASTLLA